MEQLKRILRPPTIMYETVYILSYGKRESNTRCPVSNGWLAGNFSVTGRGWRTGHTFRIKKKFIERIQTDLLLSE